ncbi:unnamed protein product [Protopolystoma xenopodis]|uniref:Uncharacterized protein n=1 Tax=Protopolystoma xenopodis TaxID=117903 RepID=A0A3S5A523_9PLAT|nr:unnamed protein product [Protopolystoma xenopodis]
MMDYAGSQNSNVPTKRRNSNPLLSGLTETVSISSGQQAEAVLSITSQQQAGLPSSLDLVGPVIQQSSVVTTGTGTVVSNPAIASPSTIPPSITSPFTGGTVSLKISMQIYVSVFPNKLKPYLNSITADC